MKQSVVVLDDVFDTTDSLSHLIDNKLEAEDWYDLDADHPYKKFCLSVLEIAGEYYDLTNMVGYELWDRRTTGCGWHIDKDEKLYEEHNELSLPLCSTVYYLDIQGLKGGQLLLEHDIITPKPNRLVMFAPAMYHTVLDYTGNRVSLLVNPWDYKL